MKKIKVLVLCFLFAIVCLCFLFTVIFFRSNKAEVLIVKKSSWFSDFHVKGDSVEILCEVTLRNSSDTDCRVKINALFPEDVGKLLTEDQLTAKDEYGSDAVFFIPAKAEKSFKVLFVGTFAGVQKKHDRNLPEFQIIQVE